MCQERKPHKHAAFIKAWADNPKIEFQVRVPRAGRLDTQWEDVGGDPVWIESLEYRIKPKEPIVRYIFAGVNELYWYRKDEANIKLTLDPETFDIISVEKI